MTKDYIADALSQLDDRYIVQAVTWRKKRMRRIGSIAACFAAAVGIMYSIQNTNFSQLAYSVSRVFGISNSSSACLAWIPPEEIFAQDTVIFRGTVVDIQPYSDHTVYTIAVSHALRGDFSEGELVRLLTGQGFRLKSSMDGYLNDLEVGTEGIFMPYLIKDGPGLQGDIHYFDFMRHGDYYIYDGIRYLFVKSGDRVLYDDLYEIPASNESVTLDDVEAYIREGIGE